MTVRIYIQSEFLPDVKLVEVEDKADAQAIKHVCIQALPPEARGNELHLFEEDSDDDVVEHGVDKLKKPDGVRLHLHRCTHIDVTVRFAGRSVDRKFRPSTTIGRIRAWSAHQLGMTPEDAAEHVLQIDGSAEQPDVDQHVGTFAMCPVCSIVFDLVPSHRING
jgi:hypothetical protein